MKKGTLTAGLAAAAGLALSATANAQFEMVSSIGGTFIDISATGTSLGSIGDDTILSFTSSVGNALFPAGTVSVCSNGFMCAGAATGANYGNAPIPATGIPTPTGGAVFTTGTNGYLLPFWDDQYAMPNPNAETIYWQEIGGVLIVQWQNISHFIGVAGETITYQVKVFSNPGAGQPYAQFLYADTVFGGSHAAFDNGASATVGYFNDANASANNMQWSVNSPVITSGTVLSIVGQTGLGACCLPNGTCATQTSAGCASLGGVFSGAGSECNQVVCPSGACCLADGTCVTSAAGGCAALGGVYSGNGTSCGTVVCPAPVCYAATNLALPIPDGPGANGEAGIPADATLAVNDSAVITDLTAGVIIPHTWQGDLQIKLVHPDSTELELSGRPGVVPPKYSPPTTVGFGFTTDNYGDLNAGTYMSFSDGGSTVYDNAAGFPGPPAGSAVAANNEVGTFKPVGGTFASAFGGKNINGTWHLVVTDNAGADFGSIESFRICLPAPSSGPACYANCDNSTNLPCLNVQDFSCFLNAFASGTSYANCDNSTNVPVLNVQDFSCFLNAFSSGCSSCV